MYDLLCRPLSKAQQAYAQRDAHYLLYLARVLYQELEAEDLMGSRQTDKSRVMQAWDKCQRVSLNLYHKPQSQVSRPCFGNRLNMHENSCFYWSTLCVGIL